ncbi:MAG: hypothetical protein WD942_07265 [Dehalococcoidia bacterium]
MIPDPYEQTVAIPVEIRNGRPEFLHGKDAMPKLSEGAVGDLIIPAFAVENDDLRAQLLRKGSERLLLQGTEVLAIVQGSTKADGILEVVIAGTPDSVTGVKIRLLDDLHLRLRGTKRPKLAPVDCVIPSLKREARSLNEAYTLISIAYETWRRSHSGNVFRKILWRDDRLASPTPTWRRLDDLRMEKEAAFEKEILAAMDRSRSCQPEDD